jgi:hypothetical protein
MSENVYAAPDALALHESEVDHRDAAVVRREHLNTEATIRSLGRLYLIGGGASALIGLWLAVVGLLEIGRGAWSDTAASVFIGMGWGLFGALQLWIGIGLRRLRPNVRVPACIISGIGMLGFPMGTLINGYFLYILRSAKGRRVLDGEYSAVMEATPDIRYRTPRIVWVLFAFVLLLFAFVLLLVVLAAVGAGQ